MNLIEMDPPIVAEPNWKRLISRKIEREAAAEHWRIVTTEMESRQSLSASNAHAIQRLVLAMIMHDRAAAKAMRAGPVNEPDRGNPRAIPRPNLYFTAMREAAAMIAQLESDLGLSPRTRNRVGKIARIRKSTGASRYLRSVPSLPRPAAEIRSPLATPEKEPAHD